MKSTVARAVVCALALTLATVSTTMAWSGERNAIDCCQSGPTAYGQGEDNPGSQGSYSVDNTWQDFYLSEWGEPYHDWMRDRYNRWSSAAVNNVLLPNRGSKALGFQLSVVDQYFYNFAGSWSTNLPYSKAPENENWFEEMLQGYTEVDTEISDPGTISAGVDYFIDYQMDSEKPSEYAKPRGISEIEWCDKSYVTCNYDETGIWYGKAADVQ